MCVVAYAHHIHQCCCEVWCDIFQFGVFYVLSLFVSLLLGTNKPTSFIWQSFNIITFWFNIFINTYQMFIPFYKLIPLTWTHTWLLTHEWCSLARTLIGSHQSRCKVCARFVQGYARLEFRVCDDKSVNPGHTYVRPLLNLKHLFQFIHFIQHCSIVGHTTFIWWHAIKQ